MNESIIKVTSPLTGIFDTTLEVGHKVKKGDVLCVIEAMKTLNEITSPRDGEVIEICIKNDSLVQAEQTLFIIKIV